MKTIALLFALILVASVVVFALPKDHPVSSPSMTTPTGSVTPDETAQIVIDVINTSSSCGPAKDKCTIDKVIGNFARGTMPMGYWFAVKNNSKWQVVLTGNGIPACIKVDEFSIPKELYTNCLDTSNQLRY